MAYGVVAFNQVMNGDVLVLGVLLLNQWKKLVDRAKRVLVTSLIRYLVLVTSLIRYLVGSLFLEEVPTRRARCKKVETSLNTDLGQLMQSNIEVFNRGNNTKGKTSTKK